MIDRSKIDLTQFSDLEERVAELRKQHAEKWDQRIREAADDQAQLRMTDEAEREWFNLRSLYESGVRLRMARMSAGFPSAAAAARAKGFHKQNLADHEAGRRRIQPEQANAYALAFNVSPSWILFGEEEYADPLKFEGRIVPVVGEIREAYVSTPDDSAQYVPQIPIKLPGFDRATLSAFKVVGNHPWYEHDSYLITCDREDAGVRLGDHLVVQVARGDYFRYEIRGAARKDEEHYARSGRPEPLDGSTAVIKGVVVQSIRPRPLTVGPLIKDSNLLLT